MRKGVRAALIALAAIVALALAGGLWWGLTPLGPSENALAAMASGGDVSVRETRAGIEFAPTSAEPTAALIFYPGGHVDARSYAPLARDIAASGRLVIIVPMPLSLAVLAPNSAGKAIESHPEIGYWMLGGHSLGGAMAARYASRNPGELDALLLLAAYATEGSDVSGMEVADVVGTLDGVLNWESWEAGRDLLPDDTEVTRIEGGNHAQFGDYGPQPGDNPATISADEQRARTVEVTDALFERVAAAQP